MEIHLKPEYSIQHVKDEFHKNFENLKIEFFYHEHEVGEGSAKPDMVKGDMLLRDLTEHPIGHITYDETITVAEFEQIFRKDFQLNVQIFRHASQAWLETISTDHWTLKDANHRAKAMIKDNE